MNLIQVVEFVELKSNPYPKGHKLTFLHGSQVNEQGQGGNHRKKKQNKTKTTVWLEPVVTMWECETTCGRIQIFKRR